MRYICLLLLTFSLGCASSSSTTDPASVEPFTGLIVYEYQFQHPTSGQDLTEQVALYLGREQHYYINAHSYKSYDEGGDLRQLYNSKTNRYYFRNPLTGQLNERDARESTAENISIRHLDETETILGRSCNMLVIETESSETTYWYSSQIQVNPEVYVNHKFGHWADFMNASGGALPLKYVVKSQNFIMTSTAREVKRMGFDEGAFQLENVLE